MRVEGDTLKEKQDFLFDVIKRYDHYIGTTNFKVGLMMSFLVTIILGLTIRLMSLNITCGVCDVLYYLLVTSTLLTITFSLISIINLFRAVFPNTRNIGGEKSLIFFGDVANSSDGGQGYFNSIKVANPEKLLKDLSTQTYNVACIVDEKFRVLKIAVNIILYAVIPLLALTLIFLILYGIK